MTIALAALALGVPALVLVLWPLFRDRLAPASLEADDERAGVEAEKAAALRALRELRFDYEAGHMADDEYGRLRARYEARAATLLRRLDELGPRPPVPTPAAPVAAAGGVASVPWTRRPAVLGATGAGLLAFGVLLGVLVSRFAAPDPTAAVAPGRTTGAAGATETSPRPLPKELVEGMLRAAHASLDGGRYQEAIAAYKAVLKRDPKNVDAITHLGVILGLAGHADGAVEAFDRALAIDPSYAHALWDKARVLYELRQDYAGAIAAWERFVQVAPPGADRDQALARIGEARARLAAAPKGGSGPASPKP